MAFSVKHAKFIIKFGKLIKIRDKLVSIHLKSI